EEVIARGLAEPLEDRSQPHPFQSNEEAQSTVTELSQGTSTSQQIYDRRIQKFHDELLDPLFHGMQSVGQEQMAYFEVFLEQEKVSPKFRRCLKLLPPEDLAVVDSYVDGFRDHRQYLASAVFLGFPRFCEMILAYIELDHERFDTLRLPTEYTSCTSIESAVKGACIRAEHVVFERVFDEMFRPENTWVFHCKRLWDMHICRMEFITQLKAAVCQLALTRAPAPAGEGGTSTEAGHSCNAPIPLSEALRCQLEGCTRLLDPNVFICRADREPDAVRPVAIEPQPLFSKRETRCTPRRFLVWMDDYNAFRFSVHEVTGPMGARLTEEFLIDYYRGRAQAQGSPGHHHILAEYQYLSETAEPEVLQKPEHAQIKRQSIQVGTAEGRVQTLGGMAECVPVVDSMEFDIAFE
ncbi:hypothetical protein M011DRAFT_498433, partial [Sporormia fimetaria CBS 119925]